jgi:hypothetical protein
MGKILKRKKRKIILPTELVDQQLKETGIDGLIDPGTGLLLPRSPEAEKIIRDRLEHAD